MSNAEREAFLAVNRYGILATLRRDGSPIAIPVWFDWDGDSVRMFTTVASPKLRRLANDARASVLVTNHIDEKEKWVAFDGTVAVSDEGGFELAEKLAQRYWDLNDPVRASALESWRAMQSAWRLLEMVPDEVRTYAD
ncbi:MAG: pyridoxamine 5'-phosphate oxidase family protein [Chloroflexi bacterium]|nr:pyridoxamine 5'-phosphate oxidase family protein [Chloroflexota bacterium]MCH8200573.1 pyridoxamine 5'-phosphate oxidase family protein [Chloroflexota bacterium]MCI0783492.1 pyridoxamine 5'-phosphate oxidase family protein [Chloroflexota bacterium]MCI0813787.1 pyridoxamine 5'-phosphate oxidase family protein [Chloroflexota bacterium]MCI0817729.1 pyridoxamine 5'-phosphate oxidase family protein [Chloroflexota bacterium]